MCIVRVVFVSYYGFVALLKLLFETGLLHFHVCDRSLGQRTSVLPFLLVVTGQVPFFTLCQSSFHLGKLLIDFAQCLMCLSKFSTVLNVLLVEQRQHAWLKKRHRASFF